MQTIRRWLADLGLEQYATSFEMNDVDLPVLPALSDAEFDRLGVSLGHRKRMLQALPSAAFQRSAVDPPSSPHPVSASESLLTEGERRQVTVLFCDLVGSTALANRLDPEEYRRVLTRYHQTCIAAVQRFDGFVAQIQGDGVLAYFGYPFAHEGEAERAMRGALAMVDAMRMLDTGGLREPLHIRVGVASGLVVVSHVLSPEKSAVGETPNLAQRLQTLAHHDEVMTTERTRILAGGAFDYEDRGLRLVKGIAEPVRVWRVRGCSGAATRFDAATRGNVTPMVGRDQEIALLVDRWEASRSGEGQAVLLQGEPGIGKSRMLRAFREQLSAQVDLALQYQCSPYYSNSAFYPVAEHLERALKFARTDSQEARLNKIEAYLLGSPPLLGSGRSDGVQRNRVHCSLLARMLSVPCDERYGPLEMSPQRQKDDTVGLLVDIVAELALRQPTVVLFEDVHWADPTTLEVLGALLDRTETLPLLVLITYRPHFTPTWTSRAHVTALALTRLSRAQGASIVLRVAGKPLPADLTGQIVDKTDGVPLFLEELTKAVLESSILTDAGDRYDYSGKVEALSIPGTLRDSLMARLDRLIPMKEIAQIGACLGREFSYELAHAVSPWKQEQLDEALDKLVASELVFRRGTPPQVSYLFKHALVQDAAYDSILRSQRHALHAQIAEAIEKRFPSKADTEPELLAHHYTEAGMIAAAIPYWRKAGELAQNRVALQEAIRHYERALALALSQPLSTMRDAWELQLRALLGMALVELHGYTHPRVETTLEPAWLLDHSLDTGDYAVRILWGLWVYRLCTGQVQESLAWAKRLLIRAEERDDETMWIVGHWAACNSHYFLGEFEQCVHHANALLAHYDDVLHVHIADLINHDPKTVALAYRAGAEWMLGFADQAAVTASTAIRHADERKHPFDRCWVRHFEVLSVYGPRADIDRANTLIAEMECQAEEQRLLFMSDVYAPMKRALCLGWAGRHAESFVACRSALAQWITAGMKLVLPQLKAALAMSAVECDRAHEALALTDEALQQIARPDSNERYALAEVLHVRALALHSLGNRRECEAMLRRSLAVAKEQHAKAWELRTATSYARLLAGEGRRDEALGLLRPIYCWFTEGLDTRDLRDAAALLAALERHPEASLRNVGSA